MVCEKYRNFSGAVGERTLRGYKPGLFFRRRPTGSHWVSLGPTGSHWDGGEGYTSNQRRAGRMRRYVCEGGGQDRVSTHAGQVTHTGQGAHGACRCRYGSASWVWGCVLPRSRLLREGNGAYRAYDAAHGVDMLTFPLLTPASVEQTSLNHFH